MATYIYKSLADKFAEQASNATQSAEESRHWFLNAAKQIKNVDGNKLMRSDPTRLRPMTRITPKEIGRMFCFYYDPKLGAKLPYFDSFPLVLPIENYTNGFLGLNLHYLPPRLRVQLLDGIYSLYRDKHMDENKRLRISYQIMKSSSRFRWFKPCVKRYLINHVRSKFYMVDPQEWDMVAMLPMERFHGASKNKVWIESIQKI